MYNCNGSCSLACNCTVFVLGWVFIFIWKYLVSQNESDGGDWEGKASSALSCFVCCSLHLPSVVCSPLPFSYLSKSYSLYILFLQLCHKIGLFSLVFGNATFL